MTFDVEGDATKYGVVDEIAGRALRAGVLFLAVRQGDMPASENLAAILRYPSQPRVGPAGVAPPRPVAARFRRRAARGDAVGAAMVETVCLRGADSSPAGMRFMLCCTAINHVVG